MFTSTLDIAQELHKFSQQDPFGDFSACLKEITGTYTILDNGVSMGTVEFAPNYRLHITKPRETSHGEWRKLNAVLFAIGEKEEYDKKLREWKINQVGEGNSFTQPNPPTRDILCITVGEQRYYLLPFFKMHGIYGFVKFDIPPSEWTATENECVFLIKKKHQGNYRLYDRDVPRTWDDARDLITTIHEVIPKEKFLSNPYNATKIGCWYYIIAIIVGILTFCKFSQGYYKPAMGSMFLDLGLGYLLSEALVSYIHFLCLTIFFVAAPQLHSRIVTPYFIRKKEESLIHFYNRYRSSEARLTRAYRILQNRMYCTEAKKMKLSFPIICIIFFYILCLCSLISHGNSPLWDDAHKQYTAQVEKSRQEEQARQQTIEDEKLRKIEELNAETRRKNAERAARKQANASNSTASSAQSTQAAKTSTNTSTSTRYRYEDDPFGTNSSPTTDIKLPATPVDKVKHIAITPKEGGPRGYSQDYINGERYLSEGKLLEAIYWYQRSAERDYEFAQQALGRIYETKETVRNYKLAYHYYTLASAKGLAYSHYRLGCLYEKGLGCTQDTQHALDHYYTAACTNMPAAEAAYKRLGGKKDITYVSTTSSTTTTKSTTKTATKTTATQTAATTTATTTQPTPPQASSAKSSTSSKQAARIVDINDESLLLPLTFTDRYQLTAEDELNYQAGLAHLKQKDYNNAFQSLFDAAYNGHDKAQFELGKLYMDGAPGFPKNTRTALYWLRRAAEQEHSMALTRAAYIYLNDLKYKNDYRAFQCASKAANLGNSSGYYYVANCYEFGIGTKIDLNMASYYYKRAYDKGISAAKEGYDRVRLKQGSIEL